MNGKGYYIIHIVLAILLLSLSSTAQAQVGTVKSHQKLSKTEGGLIGVWDFHPNGNFSYSAALLGDVDGNGVNDMAVTAVRESDGGTEVGSVFVLLLNSDGTVKSQHEISDTQGGFTGDLDPFDRFGIAVSGLGDLDNDGVPDMAVGAQNDDDGCGNCGAVWLMLLAYDAVNDIVTVKSHGKIVSTNSSKDNYGRGGGGPFGDFDGDGVPDLVVGAPGTPDGNKVWIYFLNDDATVKSSQLIGVGAGGFSGTLVTGDGFGSSLANVGDLDSDGVDDLAVGSQVDVGGVSSGAVWILLLNSNGTVKSNHKINAVEGGFTGDLDHDDVFGFSLASIGDLDGDGIADLAVGAPHDDDGGTERGAIWILFLQYDAMSETVTVKSHQKISNTEGGFTGQLDDHDLLAWSLTSMGDLDGDGVTDLAAGALLDDDGSTGSGAVWILFLNGEPLNTAPIANAGSDQDVECSAPGGTSVTLDGTSSSDPDLDPLTFTWTGTFPEGGGTVNGPTPTVTLPLGTHSVTLTVDDGNGGMDNDEVLIVVKDTTEPEIAVAADPISLWPPNHKYHTITFGDFLLGSTDICDSDLSAADVTITSASSDEPENATGDGNTLADIVINGTCDAVDFRAERQGGGNGRIYTIHLAATDASSNTGMATFQVHVPPSKKGVALDDGPAYTVNCGASKAGTTQQAKENASEEVPNTFVLHGAYPNPFNPSTTIQFDLPEAAEVSVVIIDVLGRQVMTVPAQMVEAGARRSIQVDASTLASGTYLFRVIARVRTNAMVKTGLMTLIR